MPGRAPSGPTGASMGGAESPAASIAGDAASGGLPPAPPVPPAPAVPTSRAPSGAVTSLATSFGKRVSGLAPSVAGTPASVGPPPAPPAPAAASGLAEPEPPQPGPAPT